MNETFIGIKINSVEILGVMQICGYNKSSQFLSQALLASPFKIDTLSDDLTFLCKIKKN